jgi:ribosomal protein S18 acetylase RimI-like enzyme
MNKARIDNLSVRLRRVRRGDLRDLEWDGDYLHFRNLYKQTYELSKAGNTQMWVIDSRDYGIIGQVFVQLNGHRRHLANGNDRVYLYSIRVKPDFRNKGLGTYLLQSIQTHLNRRGVRYFTLNVAKDNTAALRFYRRLGYEIRGHDDGIWSYIDHKGKRIRVAEPSWNMELDLSNRKK